MGGVMTKSNQLTIKSLEQLAKEAEDCDLIVFKLDFGGGTAGGNFVGYLQKIGDGPRHYVSCCPSLDTVNLRTGTFNRHDEHFKGRVVYELDVRNGTLNGFKVIDYRIIKEENWKTA